MAAAIRRAMPRHPGVVLLLLALLGFWMVPIAYMLGIAFRPSAEAFDATIIAWPLTLENFATVIRDNHLLRNFCNSMVVTSGTVALVLAASSMFAYAISVLRLRWLNPLYAILLTTLMVPITTLVLPFAILLKHLDWINDDRGLILPYAALGIPFAIVVLKAFMEDAPRELFEAAMIDGCTAWQMYARVALPLAHKRLDRGHFVWQQTGGCCPGADGRPDELSLRSCKESPGWRNSMRSSRE